MHIPVGPFLRFHDAPLQRALKLTLTLPYLHSFLIHLQNSASQFSFLVFRAKIR